MSLLDIGEALLISEPKIRFAVPMKVKYHPEYLEKRRKKDYGLPESRKLSDMERRLKALNTQERTAL